MGSDSHLYTNGLREMEGKNYIVTEVRSCLYACLVPLRAWKYRVRDPGLASLADY